MSEDFAYDVFISHSSADKPAVRELAERLKTDGLRVWLDEWLIQPGDMIGLKIEEGLEHSRTLVLVMSANAFASEWVTLERHTVLFRDPTNQQRRFIPLRLDDAAIKDTLRQFAYVDWRQRADDEYTRLLVACRLPVVAAEPKSEIVQRDRVVPGKVLKGHTNGVGCVAMTADGQCVVSGSDDGTVRVWDMDTGMCIVTLEGHTNIVWGVAVRSDGRRAISSSRDSTVRVWDVYTGACIATLKGHTDSVRGVSLAPDGRRAVSGSGDYTVQVWDLDAGTWIATLKGHTASVRGVSLTPDGRRAVSGSDDYTVRVWDLDSGRCIATLKGHTYEVYAVAVTADGRRAISGSRDSTIRVWDLDSGRCIATLEGHTSDVYAVAVTPDGRRAVSGSGDRTTRVWNLDSGRCIATLEGHTSYVYGVAVTADGRRVVSGSADQTIRVWDLPPLALAALPGLGATRYTNAKVLLVGDSGVGKTGLALRLAENRFAPTISTDGAWATQLKLPHDSNPDGIEREIWLWDFAGQADYRLVHQLYMDETALAVLVFNPQSEDPFEGLGQWDRDLHRAARRSFSKLLVAGRCDRGGLMISRAIIAQFQAERGFAGYLETSARTGSGCAKLLDAIIENIPWDDIPWTASPRIFKLLKAAIMQLKDEGKVLLRIGELKQQLDMRLTGEVFSLAELRAVVGLLAGPGIVCQLEFGDFVLLQPERLNAYAAAVIRSVRAHTGEIGCILEENVLAGQLDYQDMRRLPPTEEPIMLRAMHQTFVDHGLCLREHSEAGTLLVFPSYFKRERPELAEHPAVFVTYLFSGPLDEIYATLVVRLHHTPAFEKATLWRFAADFKTQAGKRVGLKLTKQREGAAEITIYCETGIPDDTKVMFIRYVHDHLKAKDASVVRVRHYSCPHCGTPVEGRKSVQDRLNRGLKDIICVNCEKRVPLWDLIEEKFASDEFQQRVRRLEEQARTNIDAQSRELILIGHAFAIAGEAGQVFRQVPSVAEGIDGAIIFTNDQGAASDRKVYLQLKTGDAYLRRQQGDEEIFEIKDQRSAERWQALVNPVMLVSRSADGHIYWMNITEYLKQHGTNIRVIVFAGEPFTALNLVLLRDRLFR